MGMTRRSFLGLIGGVPLAASLASGCGFIGDLVGGDSGDKTVNVVVFLPQGEGANFQAAQAGNILASLKTAACLQFCCFLWHSQRKRGAHANPFQSDS